jgi:chaperonin GroEL
MAKQIKFNEEARSAIKRGIDKLAEAVTMTLGPRGRAVVIEKGYGAPQVTFDGVTVAKEIEFEDKWENLGAEFIKQAADKTNDGVGDGTTTATILAHAMIDEGEKVIREKGFNVIQLAEELRKSGAAVVRALESQRELINDNKKIKEVATLSAKDADIGTLIATVMEAIKKRASDGRGFEHDRQFVRDRGRHAVRPRLHLAIYGVQSGSHGSRARRSLCPRDGQKNFVYSRHSFAPRKNRAERQKGLAHRRGRR